jgi:hypothetical protein
MKNDSADSGAAESNKDVRDNFVLKISVLHSEISGLLMRTTSLAYQDIYITSTYIALTYSRWYVHYRCVAKVSPLFSKVFHCFGDNVSI